LQSEVTAWQDRRNANTRLSIGNFPLKKPAPNWSSDFIHYFPCVNLLG
jgi:hypothetical protein